jgi:hypothetical protein
VSQEATSFRFSQFSNGEANLVLGLWSGSLFAIISEEHTALIFKVEVTAMKIRSTYKGRVMSEH